MLAKLCCSYLRVYQPIEALTDAVRRCMALDRVAVRSSAQRRLGLDPALDRYEAALDQAAQ